MNVDRLLANLNKTQTLNVQTHKIDVSARNRAYF